MATSRRSSIKLLLFSFIFTTIFCVAIGLDISPFLRGPAPYAPEWRWVYDFTNTLSKIWVPILAGILGGIGIFYFDKEKNQKDRFFPVKFLFFIIFFVLFLQFSILFFSRSGVGVLLERIINPGISGYFTTALSVKNIAIFLSTYQQMVVHFPMRAADHPPFAVLFFSLIIYLSQFLKFIFPVVSKISIHQNNINFLWNSLLPNQKIAAMISTVFIPLLSSLISVPLYFFAKGYYGGKIAVRAVILYAFFPSVSLFLPLNDAFIGIFGILGFLFIVLGQSRSRLSAFIFYLISGLFFAIGIFFSVSMIVPSTIAILMLCLYAKNKQKIIKLTGLIAGVSIIPVFLFIFFHFNTVSVFVEITRLQAKRSYLPWVFYDLYDFFIFSGIPILICTVIIVKNLIEYFMRSLTSFRMTASIDKLAVSFFTVILVLDILGFSRAESGRIWMPYMPILASVVAAFLTKIKKISTNYFLILILLQFVQLLTMQEFWVTLW